MLDNLRGLASTFTHARSFRCADEVTILATRLTAADAEHPNASLGLSQRYREAVEEAREWLRSREPTHIGVAK